ncbi:acyl-coenzyme A thioesterase 13 [Garra rufa]|uniref:acyl-coenzyme A thioesterase 13 n=1 Tax=Garra rufa TaxID=137080 RepID=UPI003CCE8FB8
MASLSLNSIKQIMRAMVDCPGFDRVLSKGHINKYMNAAKIGEDVLITAQVLKQGRTLAFATVDLTNKANGKLIAQGRHTKHLGS